MNYFSPPTEEELSRAIEYTERIASLLGTSRLSSEEKQLAQSCRQIDLYRKYVEAGHHQYRQELAQALIVCGRFEEALEVCELKETRELIEARDRDNEDRCPCPEKSIQETQKKVIVPSEYVVRRQFNPKRNRFNWLIRCSDCGHLNLVENLPAELAQLWLK